MSVFRLKDWWKHGLLASMGMVLAVGGVLAAGAWYLLRRRSPDPSDPPTNYDLSYQEVAFHARDGVKLRGWWIPAPSSHEPAPTVIMAHGQAGSMDGDTAQMVPLHQAGFNVLMFDFRGHGRSEGNTVTMGVHEKADLLGAVDYLTDHHGCQRVGVLGFSMGAAVAVMAAAESERIASVVADSSYTTLEHTLRRWSVHPSVPSPLYEWIVDNSLTLASVITGVPLREAQPISAVSRLADRPVLFIYGERDPFVTVEEMRQMSAITRNAELWLVPDAGHRDAYHNDPDTYNQRVIGWFKRWL